MAETAVSAVETALENQRIGGLQIRVAAICRLVQMCDGYDVNSIGLVGAVVDPRLEPAAAGLHDGVSVVEHRHHGRARCRPGRSATASGASRC